MIRFLKGFFFVIGFLVSIPMTAQEIKPVQFSFSTNRDASGQAFISIKAKISPGVQLFSTKKNCLMKHSLLL